MKKVHKVLRERRVHLDEGSGCFLDKVIEEDSSLRATFTLRPKQKETAVQSCRNTFQAEGHPGSLLSMPGVVSRPLFFARIVEGSLSPLG